MKSTRSKLGLTNSFALLKHILGHYYAVLFVVVYEV